MMVAGEVLCLHTSNVGRDPHHDNVSNMEVTCMHTFSETTPKRCCLGRQTDGKVKSQIAATT